MRRTECAREPEMLAAVVEGGWPDRCDTELRAHLAECGICEDLIEVAAVLSSDRETAVRDAAVPGSGVMWWRTQLRLRHEKLRAAQRRVTALQTAIVGAALCFGLVVLGAVSMLRPDWLVSSGELRAGADLGSIAHMIPWSTPLCLALVAWLAVAPLAARFALIDKSSD